MERIDLYQVHWPPADGTALEDYWGTMVELRDAGHVRAIGLSNRDPAQLEAAGAAADAASRLRTLDLRRTQRHACLRRWRHAWLLVHGPLSAALLVLGVVHAIVALKWI